MAKKFQKKDWIRQVIVGILILLLGIFLIVLSFYIDDSFGEMMVLSLGIFITVFSSIIILVSVFGILRAKDTEKKALKLINDGVSFASMTYGGNGGYKFYQVIIDKAGQSAGNAATNVAGAVGFLFLGFGVFRTGVDSIDCFVSKDEIVLNNKANNPEYKEELFSRYHARIIRDIYTAIEKRYVKVIVNLFDGKSITMHIPCDKNNAAMIKSEFDTVKMPAFQSNIFNATQNDMGF